MPPDTTAKLQAMEQGVAANFKVPYRRRLIDLSLIIIRTAHNLADVKRWRNMKAPTILHCFQKGGFSQGRRPTGDEAAALGIGAAGADEDLVATEELTTEELTASAYEKEMIHDDSASDRKAMAVSILGALIIILYYIAVVFVGVWSGRKVHGEQVQSYTSGKHKEGNKQGENDYLLRLFLANRSVPLVLGVVSMTATWVGGAFLMKTTETVFTDGIVWCQAPFGYGLSLMVGGWFFAGKMRVTKALTMLDPFQQYYGKWISVPLTVPAVFSEVFWTASVLTALGDTVETIVHLDSTLIIIASAIVILFYTALGGLYSVIYTDLFQMFSTVIGLWTCLPYVVMNKASGKIGPPQNDWIGSVEPKDVSQIVDLLFMTVFGGIPWQGYFQRVLSTDSIFGAKMLSYLSAICCLFVAVPSIVVGAVAKTTNFTALGYNGSYNLSWELRKDVLPQAMHYMTPSVVAILGQLAITASVMSSMDSSMLSASSLITRNIYHFIIRPTVRVVVTFLCDIH
ncbi:hypothetical protein HPB50_001419 [Hyalomma asiaticum]|uniref:Uncharacterized protein n=1 Tax=Hyalomma asiaticum TaxID=266040 RepID=A0ACB7TD43_HYAAI|nr:hypothetical protein HPB50_001419 [Hyalomma asiaticum]